MPAWEALRWSHFPCPFPGSRVALFSIPWLMTPPNFKTSSKVSSNHSLFPMSITFFLFWGQISFNLPTYKNTCDYIWGSPVWSRIVSPSQDIHPNHICSAPFLPCSYIPRLHGLSLGYLWGPLSNPSLRSNLGEQLKCLQTYITFLIHLIGSSWFIGYLARTEKDATHQVTASLIQ